MANLFDFRPFHHRIAFKTDEGQQLTYEELDENCSQLSEHFKGSGLAFCLCDNDLGSITGYCGFLKQHIPVLLLDGGKDSAQINLLIECYKPTYIWVKSTRVTEFEGKELFSTLDYSLLFLGKAAYPIHPDLALLLTTSGSTGSPKLVRLTTKNIQANAESIAEYLNIHSDERPVTSLPMHYSFGLSVIHSHLLKGATILLTKKAVIQREFWDFVESQKATSLSGVPFTYEMLKRMHFFKKEIPHLKTLTQAGGKLNPELARFFVENSEALGKQFIIMYGQTEATARMSYLPWVAAKSKFSSVGIPIPGGRFYRINAQGERLAEHEEEGELVYEGANVSMGYAGDYHDLALGDENHGILHTGDLAKTDADGFFYITGRLKRFVKLFGNRCNLDSLEQLLHEITSDCACVGVDDLVTVYTTEPGLEHTIRTFLSQKTGIHTRAFSVKTIEQIPKTAAGKIRYTELE